MGFFDTLTQTITGRNEAGRTPQEEAQLHRAKFLEYDFYCFAQAWIIPGGHVHSSAIVRQFQDGVWAKYNGEEQVTDIEVLQLMARWNERYAKAKWNPKGTYIGIQLNPAAMKARDEAGVKAPEATKEKKKEKKKAPAKKVKIAQAPPAEPKPLTATFRNTGRDPALAKAELYYEQTRWGNIGSGDPPISVGSFTGHRWFVKVGDKVMMKFVVGTDDVQEFAF